MDVLCDKMWEGVVPFTLMFLMEGVTIALTITANSAMSDGMNQFVFVTYSNALSSIVLLSYTLTFHRDAITEIFSSIKLLTRFFILGLTGITIAQNLAYTGLKFSSPIVVCAMGLLLPSFQFILALIFRKTKLNIRAVSSQAKIAGTLVSIVGAAVVFFYEGPSIIQASLHHTHNNFLQGQRLPLQLVFVSSYATSTAKWILGCALLASATVSLAVWSRIQTTTIKRFPDVMVIVTGYILFGTIQTAVIDLTAERDLSAWKLELNLELAIIILTAIFGTFVRSWVQAWCASIKGPKYVPLFKPFGIFWACLIGLSLFGSSLRYGNVMGAIIVGIGYYTVLWGIDKEEQEKEDETEKMDPAEDMIKAPLLAPEEEQV